MPFGNRKKKNILESLFSSVLSQFKKYYHPYGNLKFNNFGFFQSLKFRILMEKILPIFLMLNFTPDNLDSYGLKLKLSVCIGFSQVPLHFSRQRTDRHSLSVSATLLSISSLQ